MTRAPTNFPKIGKQYGTKPGFYLMVGPNWKGETPAGITAVVRSSTSLAFVIPRIFIDDSAGGSRRRPAVDSARSSTTRCREFDGKMKIGDWSKLPHFPAPKSTGKGETKWVNPETFFDELPGGDETGAAAAGRGSPLRVDRQRAGCGRQGRGESRRRSPKPPSPPTERLIDTVLSVAPITAAPPAMAGIRRSTMRSGGTDYLNRTGTAKSNMFDNLPDGNQVPLHRRRQPG